MTQQVKQQDKKPVIDKAALELLKKQKEKALRDGLKVRKDNTNNT